MLVSFVIIVIHFITDFIFQAEEWALGKSKNIKSLLSHTITYSLLWIIPIFLVILIFTNFSINIVIEKTLMFVFITFISHTITDFYTSKIVSKLFEKKKLGSNIPNLGAFTMIGFDQVLHYAQLFLTYYFITQY